ncbi:MAG TPA: YARHG domain-containing protein [Polyangia bacterium]|nr:YARHG domain-containing protein [Polyangia bacterium]
MRRSAHALLAALALASVARAEETFQPAPADQVTNYFPTVMPCEITREDRTRVKCKDDFLAKKSLRELSILRNTIYARYGWDGYRKPWLRDYFHSQSWFKANPKFTYKVLSDSDRKNAHLIGAQEQSLTDVELRARREEIFAHYGKIWNDKPEWDLPDGGKVKSCKAPKGQQPLDEFDLSQHNDCFYAAKKWYKPDPSFDEAKISAADKVELGLLSRAMGSFALDDDSRGKQEESLDKQLTPAQLRQLSLRDLRLLRNTIYARRGRTFKSQILRDHFEGMSWYKVDPNYSDKLLTKADTRNIALIKSVENEFGGPLSDEDYLAEPATDGA